MSLPDLQRPRAQNARLLVLGHEWGRHALVVRDPLVPVGLLTPLGLVRDGVGVAGHYHVVVFGVVVLGSRLAFVFTLDYCFGIIVVLELILLEGGLVPWVQLA